MTPFKMLDLPAPIRIGQGMYDTWREDCLRQWTIEAMVGDMTLRMP